MINFVEKGYIPDVLLRMGIRGLLLKRIWHEKKPNCELLKSTKQSLISFLKTQPIAVQTQEANQQHYEVPSKFFELVLGSRLKYSSCLWSSGVKDLNEAEEAMLQCYCERAELSDGLKILELGCGWGSLSLWIAGKYPNSQITAVSNSASQKKFIDSRAAALGINNLTIITCDINSFEIEQKFDRIVSIEMFEHMRNYEVLTQRISQWLKPEGKLFIHIFCHKELAYLFETQGRFDWMARYFFSGGIMPSDDLLLYFQNNLSIEKHWNVNGQHYQRTAAAWRENMEKNHTRSLEILAEIYGEKNKRLWYVRWKLFFMACEELFGFRGGNEWYVSHYLFNNRSSGLT